MAGVPSSGSLPVIEMSPLFDASRSEARRQVARDIEQACRDTGFFYVSGHGVPDALLARMEELSHRFFALPREAKEAMDMARGGAAWRGWFPLGGELTSGKPDRKEGLYLGTELGPEHPRVKAGWPLHGANLWPVDLPELRGVVLRWYRSSPWSSEAQPITSHNTTTIHRAIPIPKQRARHPPG